MAKRLTKRTINKIHELHRSGLNGVAIAKAVKKSKPTVYKVLAMQLSNGAAAPKATTARHNGSSGLQEIEAIVRREVDARLMVAKQAALKALEESLSV